jgi:hypothetical protein
MFTDGEGTTIPFRGANFLLRFLSDGVTHGEKPDHEAVCMFHAVT